MNRGFLYGDGFFESIRTVNGGIPLLAYHLERILDGIDIYNFSVQAPLTEEGLISMIDPANNPNHAVRISFYRDGQGKYAPLNNNYKTEIQIRPVAEEFWTPITLGLPDELHSAPSALGKISIYPDSKPISKLFTVKSLSSAYYVQAAMHMNEQRAQYLLLTDANGNLLEELSSNLIFEKGEEILFVPKDKGQVNGVCMRYIDHLYGYQMNSRDIHKDEIDSFDAIYCCNAIKGVRRIA